MLSYFPQIRDNESTYSIFSRLQFNIHPLNYEIMGKMIFGRRFEVGRLNFQGSFGYLCKNLPSYFTPEMFLQKHTIYPLFIPFITEKKQNQAKKYFIGNYPDKINKCLYISQVTRKRTFIRICKECAKEDFLNYGEPLYRRQHEIELNRMCLKHKIPLNEYIIFPYKIPSRYVDYYTVLTEAKPIDIPKKLRDKFYNITEDIEFIFLHYFENWSINKTQKKILDKLKENGYTSMNGLTFQKKIGEDFKLFYTDDFLEYIGLNFDITDNDSWLRYCTNRKKVISDPLKYILIIRFLFGSFQDFFEYTCKFRYFEEGPYPCLNIACPEYRELVIKEPININISHGYPLATFKCKHCGFIYSRRGPDKERNDIYKKTYIKEPGKLLLKKLITYYKKGYSQRNMAKLLGISSPTVKKYIEDMDTDTLSIKAINKYKNVDENQKLYCKINKHDNHWLDLPFSIKYKYRLGQYWKNKDELLSTKITISIEEIKKLNQFYERITVHLLAKYTGYSNYYLYKDKLPKCFNIFNSECESIQDYQKRRVDYVMKQMVCENKKINFSKVIHSVGIRKTGNKEVLDYIQKKINDYIKG